MSDTLTLALKGEYFDQIKAGTKPEEFRLRNAYWAKRLEGRAYSRIVLTRGYPKATDASRRLELPYRGYRRTEITHPHFGNVPQQVYAIDVRPHYRPGWRSRCVSGILTLRNAATDEPAVKTVLRNVTKSGDRDKHLQQKADSHRVKVTNYLMRS